MRRASVSLRRVTSLKRNGATKGKGKETAKAEPIPEGNENGITESNLGESTSPKGRLYVLEGAETVVKNKGTGSADEGTISAVTTPLKRANTILYADCMTIRGKEVSFQESSLGGDTKKATIGKENVNMGNLVRKASISLQRVLSRKRRSGTS